jgi:HK97 family phage major capsid protein
VSKVEELRENIAKSREELKSVFDAPAEDGKYSADQKEKIKGLNEELAGSLDELKIEESKAANEKAMDIDNQVVNELPVVEEAPAGLKSIGEQFTNTDAYNNYLSNGVKGVDSQAEFKTTLNTTGYPPESLRAPGILETALRDPNAIIGLFDQINTDQNAYVYLEETTFTNNAAEIAESGDISGNEGALAFTERTESIRKIATFLPVTDELLADVSGIQGYVNSRLTTMMRLRMDNQLLNGNGSAPNLTGVLQKSGINTFDYSSYSGELNRLGQVYQAITEIRKDAFVEPDAVVMHPSDWYQIVTAVTDQAGTTSAGLASKNPLIVAAGGFGGDVAARLWGLKVVPSTAIAEGTALVGKFGGGDAAQIVMRQGVDLAVSDSHSDFFAKNQLAIRLTMRMGFVVYKPTAFCSITAM